MQVRNASDVHVPDIGSRHWTILVYRKQETILIKQQKKYLFFKILSYMTLAEVFELNYYKSLQFAKPLNLVILHECT